MGQASLGTWRFDIDPRAVEWDFRVKTSTHRTIGGKVVQVLGTELGDIRVEGGFGSGGWEAQDRFIRWFKDRAREQAVSTRQWNFSPLDFRVPQRGWHFKVRLKSVQEGSLSANLDVGNFSPKFTLTLFPTEDRSRVSVASAAQAAFINRISKDFGWERTAYNGPLGPEEIQAVLNGQDAITFLYEAHSPTVDQGF